MTNQNLTDRPKGKIKEFKFYDFHKEEQKLKADKNKLGEIVDNTLLCVNEVKNMNDLSQIPLLGGKLIKNLAILLNKSAELVPTLQKGNEKRLTVEILEAAATEFPRIIRRAFPIEANTPVIKNLLQNSFLMNFETTTEMMDYFDDILMRVLFSQGPFKVFDFEDVKCFNDDVLGYLFDNSIVISGEWFEQFLYCLYMKQHEENLILIKETTAVQLQFVSRLITELHGLAIDSQSKK